MSRPVVISTCLALAQCVVAYLTFVLSWSPTPRFVVAILPGAYIAAALNKVLRLPTNGASVCDTLSSRPISYSGLGYSWLSPGAREQLAPGGLEPEEIRSGVV